MEWDVTIAPSVKKRIAKIPQPEKGRILTALARLNFGPEGDIRPLKGSSDYRLRVGGWRIILSIDSSRRLIEVEHIDVRGDIYKN